MKQQELRKTRQLCRQVQRALNIALEDYVAEELSGVFVDEVTPAPDCGHLLVWLLIPAGRDVANTMAAIHATAPRLRAEVATMITRKRAPELCFVPEGGEHE